MAEPRHNLRFRMEDAISSYIKAEMGQRANVYKTAEMLARATPMAEPFVAVVCVSGKPAFDVGPADVAIGNKVCQVELSLQTMAEDTMDTETDPQVVKQTGRDAHSQLFGDMMDLFHRADILDKLNAQSVEDVTFDELEIGEDNTVPLEGRYQSTLHLAVTAHPD